MLWDRRRRRGELREAETLSRQVDLDRENLLLWRDHHYFLFERLITARKVSAPMTPTCGVLREWRWLSAQRRCIFCFYQEFVAIVTEHFHESFLKLKNEWERISDKVFAGKKNNWMNIKGTFCKQNNQSDNSDCLRGGKTYQEPTIHGFAVSRSSITNVEIPYKVLSRWETQKKWHRFIYTLWITTIDLLHSLNLK